MKNLIVGFIIVLLLVLGFWMAKSGQKNAVIIAENTINTSITTPTATPTPTSSTKTAVKPVSFTNVLPQKGNHECNYEEVTQSSRSSHTIYLSDGKMRGEFRTSTAYGGTSNIMVYDGSYLYSWVEGQNFGVRSQPQSAADFPSIIPKDILSATVLGSGLNSASWSCHAWSKVPSMLAKPTYVKF